MARYREEDEPPTADVELFVVEGGLPVRGNPAPRPSGRPAMSTGWRGALALGVAAAFALGVVVGRTSLGAQSGPGSAASSSVGAVSPTGRHDATSSTSRAGNQSSATAGSPSEDVRSGVGPSQQPGREPWPITPGACGNRSPVPLIDAVLSPAPPVNVQLISGGDPTPVDLADHTLGSALFKPGASQYVKALASAAGTTVLLIAPCGGADPGWVVRIASDGTTIPVRLPDDTVTADLVTGGDRVWVAVSAGGYGSAVTVIAADATARAITLPDGLHPIGARGNNIVGQYTSGGMPIGRIAVLDTESGRVIAQFGTSTDTATNAVADGNFVITAPWDCSGSTDSCELHRYDIAIGESHGVRLDPAVDRILAGGGAISPDGALAAVPMYDQPPSPAPFDPDPTPSTGPSRTTRIGVINLADGRLRALPGLTLGSVAGPALAFSPDGRWLIVAVGAGDKTRLLLYTADGHGPYPGVDIPGPVLWPSISRGSHP